MQDSPPLQLIKTHPDSALEFMGLRKSDFKDPLRRPASQVLSSFGNFVFKQNHALKHGEARALACALTAFHHSHSETLQFGDDRAGYLHLPTPNEIKCVVLDVDGTLTDVASPWRFVYESLDLWQSQGKHVLEQWLSGKISYLQFCKKDVRLWRSAGATFETVSSILDSIPIRPEAIKLLKRLAGKKVRIALLSSGFTRIAKRICTLAGLDSRVRIISNTLLKSSNGSFDVTINVNGDERSPRSKGHHVRKLCSELDISPVQMLAVGDGPSDKYMFERCGQSYLVSSGKDLLKLCDNYSSM